MSLRPTFVTQSVTGGIVAGHNDVSLWSLLRGKRTWLWWLTVRVPRWWSSVEIRTTKRSCFDHHYPRVTRPARNADFQEASGARLVACSPVPTVVASDSSPCPTLGEETISMSPDLQGGIGPWLRSRSARSWVVGALLVCLVVLATWLGVLLGGARNSGQAGNVIGLVGSNKSVRVQFDRISWANRGGDQAVSCPTRTFCVSVGTGNTQKFRPGQGILYPPPLADIRGVHVLYKGRAWKQMSSGDTRNLAGDLNGVSCTSISFCVAVGNTTPNGESRTLVESWNGHRWTRVPSPNHGSGSNVLKAVSCSSPSFCMAVGFSVVEGEWATLAEKFDGSRWTLTLTPFGSGGSFLLSPFELTSVSCASAEFCMATGDYFQQTHDIPLAVVYSNGHWRQVPIPDEGIPRSVACTSTAVCTAVGPSGASHPLAERYVRGTWSQVATADPKAGAVLYSVDCIGRYCFSVGETESSPYRHGLIEVLGGDKPELAQSGVVNVMNAISCSSSGRCVAVGVDDLGYTVYFRLSLEKS